MAIEPTVTAEDRFAALEREVATLRAHDRVAAEDAARRAPRSTSPAVMEREARDREAARMRHEAREARAEMHRQQAIKDEPLRVARDLKIAELAERRDAALATADQAYVEADRLSAAIAAIVREPLSREAASLPPIDEPNRPIASMGLTSDLLGSHVQMEPAAKAKWEAARVAKLAAQGARR